MFNHYFYLYYIRIDRKREKAKKDLCVLVKEKKNDPFIIKKKKLSVKRQFFHVTYKVIRFFCDTSCMKNRKIK